MKQKKEKLHVTMQLILYCLLAFSNRNPDFRILGIAYKKLYSFGKYIRISIGNPAYHFAFVEFDNEYIWINGFEDPFFLNYAIPAPVGLQSDPASYEGFQVFLDVCN